MRIIDEAVTDSIDLKFLGGEFLYNDLPFSKQYLRKYFSTEIQERFLIYYLSFSSLLNEGSGIKFCNSFVDHTGIYCDLKWAQRLLSKVRKIEEALATAEKSLDLSTVNLIKSGKFKN